MPHTAGYVFDRKNPSACACALSQRAAHLSGCMANGDAHPAQEIDDEAVNGSVDVGRNHSAARQKPQFRLSASP